MRYKTAFIIILNVYLHVYDDTVRYSDSDDDNGRSNIHIGRGTVTAARLRVLYGQLRHVRQSSHLEEEPAR